MQYVIMFVAVFLLFVPLFLVGRQKLTGKKARCAIIGNVVSFFAFCIIFSGVIFSQTASAAGDTISSVLSGGEMSKSIGYLAAALAVGLSGIGGAIAVSSSASAALGALSENDKIFGKALIFVGLAEGVALYGLIVAIMILTSL
jgi:V/A-type H+-transporting ATPase subunit K